MSCDTNKAKNCKTVYDPPLNPDIFFTKGDINAIFHAFQEVNGFLRQIFKMEGTYDKC